MAIRHTTGSTGSPLSLAVSPAEHFFELYAWHQGYIRSGLRPHHRQLKFAVCESAAREPEKTSFLGLFPRYRISATRPTAEKINFLKQYKPNALFGHASVLGEIAQELERRNEIIHVPLIFSSSDMLWTGLREQIVARLGGRIVDVYGAVETGPIAWENPADQLYHVNGSLVIVELLDEEGRHAKTGRVVCTVLWRRTVPLIRYALGDMAETTDREAATHVQRINVLHGRENELLRLPDGDTISAGHLIWPLRDIPGIRQFQIVQQTESQLTYNLVTDSRYPPRGDDQLRRRLNERFSNRLQITVKHVQDIEQIPGKKFSPFIGLRRPTGTTP